MNQTLPPPVVSTPTPAERKRRWPWIVGGLAAIAVIGGVAGAGKDDEKASLATEQALEAPATTAAAPVATAAPVVLETPAATAAPEPAPQPEPESNLTPSQENAIRSAESYLDIMGFSRLGLIAQLEFEQYSTADATFAADHLNVDWNAEAAESAESYVDTMGFSCQGLIDQLVFEKYTTAEATYGATQVGLC
jgi:host cell surface-exposed lipoprotein